MLDHLQLIPRQEDENAWQSTIAKLPFPLPFQSAFLAYLSACKGFVEDQSCLVVRGPGEIVGVMLMPVFLDGGVRVLSCGPLDVPAPVLLVADDDPALDKIKRLIVELFDQRCDGRVDLVSVVQEELPTGCTPLRLGWWLSFEERASIEVLPADHRISRMSRSKRKAVERGSAQLTVRRIEKQFGLSMMAFRGMKQELGDDVWSDSNWKARAELLESGSAQLFAGIGSDDCLLGYEMIGVSHIGKPGASAAFLWGVVSKQMRDLGLGPAMIHGVCEQLLEQGMQRVSCGVLRTKRTPFTEFVKKDVGLARFWLEMGASTVLSPRWEKAFSYVGGELVCNRARTWLEEWCESS